METLYDITEILNFKNELVSVDTVDDFLRAAVEEGGETSGDRAPRNPHPTAPIIGSRVLELVTSQ